MKQYPSSHERGLTHIEAIFALILIAVLMLALIWGGIRLALNDNASTPAGLRPTTMKVGK